MPPIDIFELKNVPGDVLRIIAADLSIGELFTLWQDITIRNKLNNKAFQRLIAEKYLTSHVDLLNDYSLDHVLPDLFKLQNLISSFLDAKSVSDQDVTLVNTIEFLVERGYEKALTSFLDPYGSDHFSLVVSMTAGFVGPAQSDPECWERRRNGEEFFSLDPLQYAIYYATRTDFLDMMTYLYDFYRDILADRDNRVESYCPIEQRYERPVPFKTFLREVAEDYNSGAVLAYLSQELEI